MLNAIFIDMFDVNVLIKHWTFTFLETTTSLQNPFFFFYSFLLLSNKLFQLAEATLDALIDWSEVVWLESMFSDPMKTQLCL